MRIGRLFGIPLRVDWSWLIVFALLVWTLATKLGPLGAVPPPWRVPAAVLSGLVFFACVVVHEFAHALVAKRYGVRTREVVLFVFGGVSRMDRVGASPRAEAAIALAGPAASVFMGALFAFAVMILPAQSPAFQIAAYLAVVNVLVAAFNLLPAYPIDGGRIVHALAWHFTGDRVRSAKIAVAISTAAGVLLACAGATLLFTGFGISGAWTVVIAWFILRMGQAEFVNEVEIQPLEMLPCGDVADAPGGTVEPDTMCDRALHVMVTARRRVLPVSVGGRFVGLITLGDFAKLSGREPGRTYVSTIMTPASELSRVAPDTSALEALKHLGESGFHQLPVVSDDGRLVGFISDDTIRRAVAFSAERRRLGMAA